ncbi:MAG: hypothetical protein BWZ10_02723 [candidate division BRC1 bacterium ADurb.BinA364]|nr:MAG: hypothetical protein BWZ10_02723 [candidate division BRC1 bacterium ADurb.BinA364]
MQDSHLVIKSCGMRSFFLGGSILVYLGLRNQAMVGYSLLE